MAEDFLDVTVENGENYNMYEPGTARITEGKLNMGVVEDLAVLAYNEEEDEALAARASTEYPGKEFLESLDPDYEVVIAGGGVSEQYEGDPLEKAGEIGKLRGKLEHLIDQKAGSYSIESTGEGDILEASVETGEGINITRL